MLSRKIQASWDNTNPIPTMQCSPSIFSMLPCIKKINDSQIQVHLCISNIRSSPSGITPSFARCSFVFNLPCRTNHTRIAAHGGASPFHYKLAAGIPKELLAFNNSACTVKNFIEKVLALTNFQEIESFSPAHLEDREAKHTTHSPILETLSSN